MRCLLLAVRSIPVSFAFRLLAASLTFAGRTQVQVFSACTMRSPRSRKRPPQAKGPVLTVSKGLERMDGIAVSSPDPAVDSIHGELDNDRGTVTVGREVPESRLDHSSLFFCSHSFLDS